MSEEIILEELRRRRFTAALDAALAWWRTAPRARLGTIIARLDAQLATPSELTAAARAVVDMGNAVKTHARLEALCAAYAPDPRLTDHLLSYFDFAPFDYTTANGGRVMRTVVARLLEQPDERVGAWLAKRSDHLRARKGTRKGQLSKEELTAVEDAFGAQPPWRAPALEPVDERARALLDAIEAELARIEGAAGDVEAQRRRLLEAVIADFADDGAKQVYADWLLEHGDAAGEALLLALRGQALSTAHHAALRALNRALPGATTFERGFPVAAVTADKYGVRKGTWGPELEWGTVATSDIVPSSDACHTERLVELQVGATFADDLAKLTRPLGVRHLVLTSFNRAARAAWRRVTVLGAVETLTMPAESADEIGWFLANTSVGQQAVEVNVPAGAERTMGAPGWFSASPRLQRISVGEQLLFTRGHSGTDLTILVASAAELERVRALLPSLTTELGHVTVRSPLGRTSSVEATDSAVAGRAQVSRDGDVVRVEPAPIDILDAAALRAIVSRVAAPSPPRRVVVARNWDSRELGGMWHAARAGGVVELELVRTPFSRAGEGGTHQRGDLRLTLGDRALTVEYDAPTVVPVLAAALAQLGPIDRALLRPSPGMRPADADEVECVAREGAREVAVVPQSQSERFQLEWVKSRRRAVITPRHQSTTTGALTPATADALIAAASPPVKPVELRLACDRVALGEWIGWLRGRDASFAIALARSGDGRLTPATLTRDGDGVVLTIERFWSLPFDSRDLKALPAGALARIELGDVRQTSDEWADACAHAAVEVRRRERG